MTGQEMHQLAAQLYPIPRSITGDGVRETIRVLQEHAPLTKYEVPTGTKAFDWEVPEEWNVATAYIETPAGDRICNWADSRLHLVGYSVPVDEEFTYDAFSAQDRRLETLPGQPNAVPYVTSYYERRWGFCIARDDRWALERGTYRAHIGSDLSPGSLTYADLLIPGETKGEVLFSTYTCHPQQANDGLSGMVLAVALIGWLLDRPNRYSYRFFFGPETIGPITYLASNLERLRRRVVAGYVLTCCGDPGPYSYVPSRAGDTLADRAALSALSDMERSHTRRVGAKPDIRRYTWLDRGSDERQYCSPGVDLPVCWVGRSKWGEFPEYHTSADDLDFITPAALEDSFRLYQSIVRRIEHNRVYRAAFPCEPMLSRRGLYPTTSKRGSHEDGRLYTDVHSMSDGTRDTLAVAEAVGRDAHTVAEAQKTLAEHGVLHA